MPSKREEIAERAARKGHERLHILLGSECAACDLCGREEGLVPAILRALDEYAPHVLAEAARVAADEIREDCGESMAQRVYQAVKSLARFGIRAEGERDAE